MRSAKRQSRIVAGVPINDAADYDDLLREALRAALRIDTAVDENFDDLTDRIRELVGAYIRSPEGTDQDVCTLMTRLAVCIIDVVPLEQRRRAAAN